MTLSDILYSIFLKNTTGNLFDDFLVCCQKYYETPAHSLTALRARDNKKLRGDIFEEFCVLYLRTKLTGNVWLLKDVPDDTLIKLGLQRRDMGIDIIVETADGYQAVQCKYKKHVGARRNILSWRVLSTFYALCLRTGPWDKYIVMTNCEYTLHQGKKTPKDLSICLGTFRAISREQWLLLCETKSQTVSEQRMETQTADLEVNQPFINQEQLRQLRLMRFNKQLT